MKKGTRVLFTDEFGKEREGKVIGPDRTNTASGNLAIHAKEWPNFGFYSRSIEELKKIV